MITLKRETGNIGEKIASRYLVKQGYTILDQNWQRPWGELDLVALNKNKDVIFVEVKTKKNKTINKATIGQLNKLPYYCPILAEQNIHLKKRKSLIKTAQTYLIEYKIPQSTSWQIDVIIVELNTQTQRANLRHLKNAIY